MKRVHIFILIGIIIYLITFFILINANIQTFDIKINVEDVVGIALDNETLNFGSVPPGNNAFKYMSFYNRDNNKKFLYFTSTGNVRNWMIIEDNGFYLDPQENKTIKISIFIPKDILPNKYTGKLKVFFIG